MINYKSLLKRYMCDVMWNEGTDFVSWIHDGDDDYTQEEIDELRRISNENHEEEYNGK